MKVFFSDLDNTLIYSYRHDIGQDKHCVELYQDREISFMTEKTDRLLKKVKESVCLIPLTTRTTEQYKRINLGIGVPGYALTCNGGVLLKDGKEDDEWYQNSLNLVSICQKELKLSEVLLAQDKHRCLDIHNINQLFIYTKSEKPEETVSYLKKNLDTSHVEVLNNINKIYVVPKALSKGMAVRRFCEKFHTDLVIAAGDSIFDLSMLKEAEMSFAPKQLGDNPDLPTHVRLMDGKMVFSEQLLLHILQEV